MARRTAKELIESGLQPKSRGEGSIFKVINHGQEKWRATYTLFMDGNTPVQVSGTGSTREEAIRNREANKQKRLIKLGEMPPSAAKPNKSQC